MYFDIQNTFVIVKADLTQSPTLSFHPILSKAIFRDGMMRRFHVKLCAVELCRSISNKF